MPVYSSLQRHMVSGNASAGRDVVINGAIDAKTLGAALRASKILLKGDRVAEWRKEKGGVIVAFAPGFRYSIVLTPKD